jgi:hypothetical protein
MPARAALPLPTEEKKTRAAAAPECVCVRARVVVGRHHGRPADPAHTRARARRARPRTTRQPARSIAQASVGSTAPDRRCCASGLSPHRPARPPSALPLPPPSLGGTGLTACRAGCRTCTATPPGSTPWSPARPAARPRAPGSTGCSRRTWTCTAAGRTPGPPPAAAAIARRRRRRLK